MLFIATASIAVLASCNNAPKADQAVAGAKDSVIAVSGTDYSVDSTSLVTWTGSKPTGQHTGTFKLTAGTFTVKDGALVGGTFTIDINSLSSIDLASDADGKGKLEGHLKSPDFFDAGKFPNAKFEITSVTPFVADSTNKDVLLKDATHTIKGNLTLKDSTKSISFPAKITVDATKATALADFNIDRTQWGMNYKGPNNPQDWVISKTVNIKLAVNTIKK